MEPLKLHSLKATSVDGKPMPPLMILFDTEPDRGAGLEASRRTYEDHARQLIVAMGSLLPQGLMHALLIEILKREVCVLAVAVTPEVESLRAEVARLLALNADLYREGEEVAERLRAAEKRLDEYRAGAVIEMLAARARGDE